MALAQTLVTRPGAVVLDEPTTGLDPATRGAVLDRLCVLARGGTALVLLTHDLDAVARIAAAGPAVQVLRLDHGRVVRRGPAGGRADAPRAGGAPAGDGDARLAVRGLTVRSASGVPLLSGVDLTLGRGGCLAVVGPSGAGKTTLGRALAGLAPHTGRVLVDGAVPARRAVQYVHQDCRSAFLDHRSVLDQVARPAVLLHGSSHADARAGALALLDRLGLARDTVARRPGGLSGGQLQRASVARALLVRPSVLVADEATSALDGGHRRLLLDELGRARREEGLAVVLISHDPVTVAAADRVLALSGGRVAAPPGPTPGA